MATRWSTAEDKLLRQLYADHVLVEQIAIRLRRSPDAVVARRQALGIAARRQSRPWSPQEEALLRASTAAGLPAPLLAERLHRSSEQVRAHRRTLVPPWPPARPYMAHEDEAIRSCLAAGGNLSELARRLGRSPDALRLHAQHLGLHHPLPRRRWTDWEDALIRDGYSGALSCAQIARELPHRSSASVAARGHKLGLASYARRWSSQDDQRLAQLTARKATLQDVAQQLARTPEAIRRRAARLGAVPPTPAPAPRRGRHWTTEEDQLLRLHHALNPARLGELVGRSDTAVCHRLCALGLRESAQRSPHHPISRRNGQPTPGERAVLERELEDANARGRMTILRRLEYSVGPAPAPHSSAPTTAR